MTPYEKTLYEGTLLGKAVTAVNEGKIGIWDLDHRYAVHKYGCRLITYADHLACIQAAPLEDDAKTLAELYYSAASRGLQKRPLARRGGRRAWRRV